MILTKDNLLRFVREKKYVTPTLVSENFDTTTMIASAALSEIAKEKLIGITNLKVGSTPYYFDVRQPQCLTELGEKHFSNYDKEAYIKLKNEQVLNDSSISIQIRLALDRIKDFASLLEIDYEGKKLKFWVWYLRDIKETKNQILEVLNPNKKSVNNNSNNNTTNQVKKEIIPEVKKSVAQENVVQNNKTTPTSNNQRQPNSNSEDNKSEIFIENYFRENYLKIESKNKKEKSIIYDLILKINKLTIYFDSIYYTKKPTESEILRFYSSSNKPKIIFIENAPKKFFKLAENLDNVEVVNI